MTPVAKPIVVQKSLPKKVEKPSLPKDEKKTAKTTKEAAPEPNGSTRGLKWGLNLHHTLRRVMEENFTKHLSDEKIIEFLLSEFPNRENKNILYNVREIRWRYNFGKLHEDKEGNPHAPEKKAVRYNPDGTVYEKKTKNGQVSEVERTMKIEERHELETECRKAEAEALTKIEERIVKLKEKIAKRRTDWEKRNGNLPTDAPKVVAPKPKKLLVKKA